MFPDTNFISSSIYSDSQLGLESSFSREYLGLLVNEAAEEKQQRISSMNLSNPFSFGGVSPFGVDPFNLLGLQLSDTSSPSSNRIEDNRIDFPFVSDTCDDSPAGNDAASISASYTPGNLRLDLPIDLCPIIEDHRLPVSESSSESSTPELETSLGYRFLELDIASSALSSSPANRSARQRNGVSTTSTAEEYQAGAREATASAAAYGRVPCSHQGCTMTYYDKSTMRRHLITCHLKIGPKCPGCGKKFSRKDSLKRHLENEQTYLDCRVAAMANDWEEVEHGGKMKLSKRSRTNRRDLLAAYQRS